MANWLKPDVLPNGDLVVPVRLKDEASGAVGHGVEILAVGSKEHSEWLAWMKKERVKPRRIPESDRPFKDAAPAAAG